MSNRVTADVSRTVCTKSQQKYPSEKSDRATSRLFLLNIFLTALLVVLLVDAVLARAESHLSAAVTVNVIAAVTAIVTSWCLSMVKKVVRSLWRQRVGKPDYTPEMGDRLGDSDSPSC